MATFLQTMAYPFLACLILTGIHVYLGIHVIQRKVIFVDLALATIAALGAVWGALLGWDIHEHVLVIKGFSLAFTIAGAAIFSLTRMRHERVPQEAFIGIAYAVALAAIILGSSRLPHGAEEVRDLQAGSILWISGTTILWTALLYSAVGLFHYIFRRQFFAISEDPARAQREGLRVRLWDFWFYVSFGFVVTSSVSIAGVLLVFSYLVIPSVIAILFASTVRSRLVVGWIVGTLVSASGVTISYFEDLPSGPVIVVCFGVCLVLAGVIHHLWQASQRGAALVRVVGFSLLAVAFVQTTMLFKHEQELDLLHLLESGTKAEQILVLTQVEEQPELWERIAPQARQLLARGAIEVRLDLLALIGDGQRTEFLDEVLEVLLDPDDVLRERALKCVRELNVPESAQAILNAAQQEEDDYLRVELAEALLEFGDPRGIPLLLSVMAEGEATGARGDAYEHLLAHVRVALPYRSAAPPSARAQDLRAFEEWWEAHKGDESLVRPSAEKHEPGPR